MDSKDVLSYFKEIAGLSAEKRVIGLTGVLGAGKTHLVKELVGCLFQELEHEVSSPTYTVCNIYKSAAIEIHHYDLYRIETAEDLYETGIMESVENEQVLVFIEWVDMYPELVKVCDHVLAIRLDDRNQREFAFQK